MIFFNTQRRSYKKFFTLKAGNLPGLSVLGLFQLNSFCVVFVVVVLWGGFLFSFLQVFFLLSHELMSILAVNYRHLITACLHLISGV